MLSYLKQSMMSFFYLIFMIMTSICIGFLEAKFLWLKITLGILNIALYGVIIAGASYKDGQVAMRTRNANDMERENIIRTGKDIKLKLHEEYKPWKGFFAGLLTCVPLIALLIAHTILVFGIDPSLQGAGRIAGLLYNAFFMFFRFGEVTNVTFYGALVCVPFILVFVGVPYILGAKSVEDEQLKVKEIHKEIYGD